MKELTHNNHFRFGYNGAAFNFRISPDDHWWVAYGASERLAGTFREECTRTAHLITTRTRQPIVVLFSGGVDSEVVMRAFKDAHIKVSAAILRFHDGLNSHDIEWAVRYCDGNAVPYKFYDLDVQKFLATEVGKYAYPVYATDPNFCTTMWLIDQIDGFPILGSGDDVILKRLPKSYRRGDAYPRSTWDVCEKEFVASWYRHFMIWDRAGVPGFFQYTPELMYAYFTDPIIVDLVNNRCPDQISTYTAKFRVYQSHYPELIPRPKFHGFEHVLEQSLKVMAQLQAQFPNSEQIAKTPYHRLVDSVSYHGRIM